MTYVLNVLEILPTGLRPVEDSSYEIGQESAIHSPTDGPVQHAMCHLWRVHLQRQEVQCKKGGCRERGLFGNKDLQILYKGEYDISWRQE